MNRLLILSCSQRKLEDSRALPAMRRYNGPMFQVVKKYLEARPEHPPEVYVLSAKHGLIPGTQPILPYDVRMSPRIAKRLHKVALVRFRQVVQQGDYGSLFLGMGQSYLQALEGYNRFIPSSCTVILPHGGLGGKLTQLKDWLGSTPPEADVEQARGYACIRGIRLELSREDVLAVARLALESGIGNHGNYQTWYVQVEDSRVSAKWLVGQLTGLPVSRFHGIEARKVLRHLGIQTVSLLPNR